MGEVWKDIEGCLGMLSVSNLGRVWRKDRKDRGDEGECRTHDNGNGYHFVVIPAQVAESYGKGREYVHRLVAKTFIPNPDNLPQVGHRDDVKDNNRADNLYWCDGSRNIRDAHKTGRMSKRSALGKLSSYSDEIVASAYKEVKMGAEITSTAEKYGMPRTTLSSIMNKRSRNSVTDPLD